MNHYIQIKFLLPTILLAAFSCGNNLPTTPPTPEYRDGAVVYVDLNRWNSINSKDPDDVKRLWDAMHVMASVQGIVNRESPIIYLDYINAQGAKTDKFWYNIYREPGKWLDGREVIEMYDPVKVADMFRDKFNGLVVYDSEVASTSSVASTVAGVEDLIAVRYDTTPGSMYTRLIAHGYEPKVWLVGENGESIFNNKLEPYEWAVERYLKPGRCDTRFAAYYPDQFWRTCNTRSATNHHQLSNHDFFISKRAFFFDLSPWEDEPATDAPDMPAGADHEMLKTILKTIYTQNGGKDFCHIGGFPGWAFKYSNHTDVGGKHGPGQTEWHYIQLISAYNAYSDADALSFGAVANSSFWQHFPLKDKYPQKWPTREELKQKGYLTADGKVDRSKRYFLLYVGDFDAAAGVYQYGPTLWEDPMRGRVPMMWCIAPSLEYRAPHILEYMRETASDKDYFVASNSGAGYMNPGMLESPREFSGLPDGVDAWAAYNKPLFDRWDISITGFIIDGNAPGMSRRGFEGYSRFSKNGIVPQKTFGLAELVSGMPVLTVDGGANDEDPAVTARDIASHVANAHQNSPFFWYRSVFKQPSWYVRVHDLVEQQRPNAVWMEAPDFFELLRCFLEENGGYIEK